MFNTLRFRLIVSYVLVVLVLLFIMGLSWLFFLRTNRSFERFDFFRLNSIAREAMSEVTPPQLQQGDNLRNQLSQWVLDLARYSDTRVILYGAQERLLLDSAALDGTAAPDDFTLASVHELGAESPPQPRGQGIVHDSRGQEWLALAIPIRRTGLTVGFLQRPSTPFRFLIENLFTPLLQAGVLGIAAALLFTVLIARWVSVPIQRLAKAAEAVAAGDLNHRVPVTGPTEFRSLATSFNNMITQVNKSQQAQRDFVTNVSHELKTPLTSIQGFSQAILDGTASDAATARHAAEIINDESERMRRLVEELLDLARLDSGQAPLSLAPIDLTAVLKSVAEKLQLSARERNVTLRNELRQQLPSVLADGDRIAQVFTNLLDNAIRHTPPGGTVTLQAKVAESAIKVMVIDTGKGIPPEDLPRIFERFYMVDKSRKAGRGYGIGLAITKELIEAHGGTITAQSVLDLGTRFTVQLPLKPASAAGSIE